MGWVAAGGPPRLCVLDRIKEPGSQGEPLYTEVATTLHSSARHEVICIGGRYGLQEGPWQPPSPLKRAL